MKHLPPRHSFRLGDGVRDYWYHLVLGVLAVWRVSHLLTAEDGPWKILWRFRHAVGPGFWGGLLDCFYCLSLWIAAPLAFWLHGTARCDWSELLLSWLALSGGAILLERATGNQTASFFEDPEGK